jgi:MFS transporter, DHA2 family, integral membrane protein
MEVPLSPLSRHRLGTTKGCCDLRALENETNVYDRRWWTLAVLCLSLVMVIVGNTVLNVALPTLVRELGATSTELQWMVDSYALVFAGLLLTGGALGDRYGRKGALVIGLIIFGLASAVSTVASTPTHLIATRAVMGLGAALVMPATLSILTTVFPLEERGRAIAIWAGFSGAGAAIGPVAGGWLLEHFWWGSVFLLNVPIVLAALLGGRYLVPTSRDPKEVPLDPIGAALSIVGLGALLFGIIEAPVYGWADVLTVTAMVFAVVVLGAFAAWELRAPHPMLNLAYFRNPSFSLASGAITLFFFAMFGTFFLLTQYLQIVKGYSPLEAGIRTLPMAIGVMIVAPQSARATQWFGAKRVVATGLVIVGCGLLLMGTLEVTSSYVLVAVSLIILSLGMGLSVPPSTTSIMSALPSGKAGVGSAVNDTTRELGGALGVAVMGSVAASRYSSSLLSKPPHLSGPVAKAASNSVGGALQVAQRIGGPTAANLAAAARHSFVDSMNLALIVGAGMALLAAFLVAVLMPTRPHPVVSE